MRHVLKPSRQQFISRVPRDCAQTIIDLQPPPVGSQQGDADRGVGERRPKPGFAFNQRRLPCRQLLGHILDGGVEVTEFAKLLRPSRTLYEIPRCDPLSDPRQAAGRQPKQREAGEPNQQH